MTDTPIDFEHALNAEQWEAVREGDGPCLVLAGAGSGKTRTITYRVAYLLSKGVSAQHILLLTFTNKAAKQMLARVEELLGSHPQGLWSGTFHSIANRLLRLYAPVLGFTQNFTILDQEDSRSLLKACVKELGLDTSARRFPSPSTIQELVSYSRNANTSLREVVEQRLHSAFDLIPVLERLAEVYAFRKREANAMDFDDLLLHLRTLLMDHPDLARHLSSQFHYVLVDEYQDTNIVQADLVRLLSQEHRHVFVVGDDAQSIYSFRAAEIRNILKFPEVFPGTRTFRLTTNYRSSPEILHVANASIGHNVHQFEKRLQPHCASCEKPRLVPQASAAKEAEYIVSKVLERQRQGEPLREMAVLFRAAFHSQALEFTLLKRRIPYEYRGGMKFFERAHIKDVVSVLRLASNPKDTTAWMRVLSLLPGVGAATAQKILEQVQHVAQLEDVCTGVFEIDRRAQAGWKMLIEALPHVLAGNRFPADMIRATVAHFYEAYAQVEFLDFRDRLDDVEQLAVFAQSAKDPQTFLDEIALTETFGIREHEDKHQDRLILSTIHQAKGLEWDTVFLMHLSQDKFPHPRALEEEGGLEEERRLFYVATTRARRRLYYTYPVMGSGENAFYQQPSLFLEEIPLAFLEQVKTSSSFASSLSGDESDRVIVLDHLGERVSPPPRKTGGFLRSVEEL
jgi:DNA helicase-2/ATP-dependent DNA helicase PcrA